MLTENYPPQVVSEIAEVLKWRKEHEGQQCEMPEKIAVWYEKWRGIMYNPDCELVDLKAQSMFSSGGISGNGELWIVEAEQKPVKPQKDVKLSTDEQARALFLQDSTPTKTEIARMLGVTKQALRPERVSNLDQVYRIAEAKHDPEQCRGMIDNGTVDDENCDE